MKKLKSQVGASITYALLLFLVCAVVGGVVLAAGTTTSGRMSKLPQMDQRYYSVVSGAQLLGEQLRGLPVQIVQEKATRTVTTVEGKNDRQVKGDPVSETSYKTTIRSFSMKDGEKDKTIAKVEIGKWDTDIQALVNNAEPDEDEQKLEELDGGAAGTKYDSLADFKRNDPSFLTLRAVDQLFGDEECNSDEAWEFTFYKDSDVSAEEPGEFKSIPFEMTVGTSDRLNIEGKVSVKCDGTLEFKISNMPGLKDRGVYTLYLTLTPTITETIKSKTLLEGDVPEVIMKSKTEYTKVYTSVVMETRTDEIVWDVSAVWKDVARSATREGGGEG